MKSVAQWRISRDRFGTEPSRATDTFRADYLVETRTSLRGERCHAAVLRVGPEISLAFTQPQPCIQEMNDEYADGFGNRRDWQDWAPYSSTSS
jgi:hypothetical protein